MPTYEYACKQCGEHLEVVQSFSDDPLTVCPNCEGSLRKVFGTIGIAFKGSGFYKTDSRAGGSSKQSDSDGTTSTSSSDTGSGSGPTTDSGSGSASKAESKSDSPKPEKKAEPAA